MRNNFDKSVFFFWMDNTECWVCGQQYAPEGSKMPGEQIDALHHCLGRISNSILNSAPIHNFACHLDNGLINHRENVKKFLKKTYNYVIGAGYKLKKKDIEFYEKHKELYQ